MTAPTPNPPRLDANTVRRTARKLARDLGIKARIIVAVMRKIIVTLNAMLRDDTPWRPTFV
jgi:hypothetical protein